MVSVDNINLQPGESQPSTNEDPAGIFPTVRIVTFGPVLSVELFADNRSSGGDEGVLQPETEHTLKLKRE